MKLLRSLLCLFLVASCAINVFSQEDFEEAAASDSDEQGEDALTEQPAPVLVASPFAQLAFLFPASPDRKFVVGSTDPVELLVGFSNEGEKGFNITAIQASLMYPQDHRYYIQNYTRWNYAISVQPEAQTTILYKFLPDPGLDARDFDLTATIFYNDEAGVNYSSVIYNGTISMVDRADSVDAQTFFTYVGAIGAVGFVAFLGYKNFFGAPSKKSRGRKIETGTRADVPASENEWLAGTSATAGTTRRAVSPRKVKASK